jgi:microcystin-dependent protein
MAIENAVYINDLNLNNPTAVDFAAEGDDHMRLIKRVLKNTFVNANGAFDMTALASVNGVPSGTIVMWGGADTAIPVGWKLCDGTNGTPDLRGKFIVGAGGAGGVAVQGTVGTNSHTVTSSQAPAHTHTGAVQSGGIHNHTILPHTLSIQEIPTHNHGGGAHQHTFDSGALVSTGDSGLGITGGVTRYVSNSGNIINSEGGSGGHDHGCATGGTHNHEMTVDSANAHTHTVTFDNRPAAVGLFYIQKA